MARRQWNASKSRTVKFLTTIRKDVMTYNMSQRETIIQCIDATKSGLYSRANTSSFQFNPIPSQCDRIHLSLGIQPNSIAINSFNINVLVLRFAAPHVTNLAHSLYGTMPCQPPRMPVLILLVGRSAHKQGRASLCPRSPEGGIREEFESSSAVRPTRRRKDE